MTERSREVVALILAAGAGTRMGGPKAILDLGGRSALARIADTCRAAGARPLVVTGAHRHAVTRECVRLALPNVHNRDWEAGRTTSIKCGWAQAPHNDVLVWPVDVPLVRTSTVAAILRGRGAPAVVPVAQGRRGHPVLLSAGLRAGLLALTEDEPLHRIVRPVAVSVDVDDLGILADLNTPANVEAALRLLAGAEGHA